MKMLKTNTMILSILKMKACNYLLSLWILSNIIASSNPILSLDPQTCTASRVGEYQLEQPLSIIQKSEEEIELDTVILQKDLFSGIAGLQITQTTSTIGHMVALRTPISTQPHVLYLQDQIPVQSSGFFNHNALAYTNFESATAVEVILGPGTALYGSDSLAGVINVQSSPPSIEQENQLQLRSGTHGYRRIQIESSNSITPQQSYRFNLSKTKNDGWRQHTAYQRNELLFRHHYQINSQSTLKTILVANQSNAQQAGDLIGEEALLNNPSDVGDVADQLDKVELRRKFDFARLSTQWETQVNPQLSLSAISYLRYNRNRYTTTWEDNLPYNDSKNNSLGILFKINWDRPWGKNTFGLDLEYADGSKNYNQELDGETVPIGTIYDYRVDYYAISPYTQTHWDITPKLQFFSGTRFDYHLFNYTNHTDSGTYADSNYYRPSDRDDSFYHISPKAAFRYQFRDNGQIYIRIANGFRIPSASRLYAQQRTSEEASGFSLKPETSDNYEIGYKQASDNQSISVALYQMYIGETITRRTNAQGDRYYENGGDTQHRGIEIEYRRKLRDDFSAKLALTHSRHHYQNDLEYGSNEMANAPRNKANIRLYYHPSADLSLILESQYQSDYWMDDENQNQYDSYHISNVSFRYSFRSKIHFYARITNLTDLTYAERATYRYGSAKYNPAAPRQVYLGLQYQW